MDTGNRHLVRAEIRAHTWERIKAAAKEASCSPALIVEAAIDAYDALPDVPRPEIVVLCGSTRFSDAWVKARYDLTLEHKIVLTIGCDTHADEVLGIAAEQKAELDELHLRKIDLADRVLVLNVGGYIGESTANEIAYATRHGKPVDYLEESSDER